MITVFSIRLAIAVIVLLFLIAKLLYEILKKL